MPAPFYNAINGTTAGTPGTGAFTPNAAVTKCRAWSTVPTGWIGLVRFEDGSAWEECYSYWNGTTLSRAATQVLDSSAGGFGVQCTLTSAATAAMVIEAAEVQSHLGTTRFFGWFANQGSTNSTVVGSAAGTTTGTASAKTLATTSLLASLPAFIITSVTTVNGQSGYTTVTPLALGSTTAGVGGFEYVARFGATTLPTGPRLFAGMTSVTFVANTAEPSALTAHVAAFGLDSTDTNIQLITNSNAGACTKVASTIPWTAGGAYEASIWSEQGSNQIYGLLIRMDTGAIWLGRTTTDVPADGALLFPQTISGLNGTNTGTALVLHFVGMSLRSGP